MARIEELVGNYRCTFRALAEDLAGPQKTIFRCISEGDERRLRARLELFEIARRRRGIVVAVRLHGTFAR